MSKLENITIRSQSSLAGYHWITLLLLGGYFSVALFLGIFLRFDFLRSDVLGYWQDSLAWQTPFHPFHVPGYPLMIAMLRGITFGAPSAIALMMTINLAAFLAGAFLIYRIIRMGGADERLALLGMLLFGLWPFVGLTYTVNPLADMPAMFFFLAGVYLLMTSRRLPSALLLGLSMVTHKAMWIFVAVLVISELVHKREYISKRNILFVAVMLLPIGTLWLSGSFYHNSITWLFSSNLEVEVASRGNLPLIDGLVGTFMEGGMKGFGKGLLLAGFAGISALTLFASIKLKYQRFHYGASISLAVLVLFLVLNQYEIWAAMRFSRLLVIPLMLAANSYPRLRNMNWWNSPASVAALSILFLSQFVYAWYMTVVYFG